MLSTKGVLPKDPETPYMKTTLLIALWLTCAGLAQPVTRLEGKV